MTSVFANLLLKFYDRISSQVPEILMVDQDLGQLEFYDQRPAVSFPCALIDFVQTGYKDKQLGAQWGEMIIAFRLAHDTYSNSSSATPQTVQEIALQYYETEAKLYKALQDWNADGLLMLPMSRISVVTERRDGDNYRVRVISFKATAEDLSAA